MPSPHPIRKLSSIAVLGLAGVCVSADTPGFKELKQGYANLLKESGRGLYDSYLKRLDALEKEYVAKKNFAAAAQVRAERGAAARELGVSDGDAEEVGGKSSVAQRDETGSLIMLGPDAETGGGVVWDKEKEALTGWQTNGAWARWHLPTGLTTGGYEVELTFACAGGSGGEVIIKEDFYTLRRQIEASGSWASFHPVVVGTLRVRTGSQSLQISAASIKGDGLFYLKSVRLVPSIAAS